MITAKLPHRGTDDWGAGHFGASRGTRTHKGIDYACPPKYEILSPVAGTITKLGYPYGDDLKFRYVEITSPDELRHRLFYVKPKVEVGDEVSKGDVVGKAQNISGRYDDPGKKPMINHVHYEILDEVGDPIDPES